MAFANVFSSQVGFRDQDDHTRSYVGVSNFSVVVEEHLVAMMSHDLFSGVKFQLGDFGPSLTRSLVPVEGCESERDENILINMSNVP